MFKMKPSRARRALIGAAAAISVGALLASCASGGNAQNGSTDGDSDASGNPIRVGALFPTSGSLALLGEESWRGVDIAVDQINADGGIDGRPIQLVRADVPDVNASGIEARRLLDVEDVQLAVGTYSSSLALAASEVYARGGGTYIELGAISVEYNTRGYEGALRTNTNAQDFAQAQVDFIEEWVTVELDKSIDELSVLMVHEDSAYGSSLARAFETLAVEAGVTNISDLPYSAEANDLTSTVLNIRQANPDVIMAVSYASDSILLSRQMAENGVRVPVFLASSGGHGLADFGATLGETADYVFNSDFPGFHMNRDAAPGLDQFIEDYTAKYGSEPASSFSLTNYVGMMGVAEILRESGGEVDRESVGAAAAKVNVAEGQTANGWGLQFDETGQNTKGRNYITQWMGGKMLTVWPEEVAVQEPQLAPAP